MGGRVSGIWLTNSNLAGSQGGVQLVQRAVHDGGQPDFRGEGLAAGVFGGGAQIAEQAVDFFDLALDVVVVFAPEPGVAQVFILPFFLGQLDGGQFEEGFDGHHGIADMVAQAGGEQAEADDAVGDHHVAQDGHFFAEQLVALLLHEEELHGLLEGLFQLARDPRAWTHICKWPRC